MTDRHGNQVDVPTVSRLKRTFVPGLFIALRLRSASSPSVLSISCSVKTLNIKPKAAAHPVCSDIAFCTFDSMFLRFLFQSRRAASSWPRMRHGAFASYSSLLTLLLCSPAGRTEGLKQVQLHKAALADKQGTFLGH